MHCHFRILKLQAENSQNVQFPYDGFEKNGIISPYFVGNGENEPHLQFRSQEAIQDITVPPGYNIYEIPKDPGLCRLSFWVFQVPILGFYKQSQLNRSLTTYLLCYNSFAICFCVHGTTDLAVYGGPMPVFVSIHIKNILDFDELNEVGISTKIILRFQNASFTFAWDKTRTFQSHNSHVIAFLRFM